MLRAEREVVTYTFTACYKPVNSVTSLRTHSRNVTEQEKRSEQAKTAHVPIV